jgi:hypothetical protein
MHSPPMLKAPRCRRVVWFRTYAAALSALAAAILVACGDAGCPEGYALQGRHCRNLKSLLAVDAGVDAAVPSTSGAGSTNHVTAGTGGTTPIAGAGASATIGLGDSGTAGTGAGSAASTGTGACPGNAMSGTEICDGQDNDCDGHVDEDLGAMPCGASTQGLCRTGKKSCSAGKWSDCVGAVEPKLEVCDSDMRDENCDGVSNERCTCTPDKMQECGMTGGICKKGTQTCAADATWGTDCSGAVSPQTEICDGKQDEDCDGLPDTSDPDCACINGAHEPCVAGLGICAAGMRTCSSGKWSDCTPSMPKSIEQCDGVDTDCDGAPDNGQVCPVGQVCTNGTCICVEGTKESCVVDEVKGPCAKGSRECSGGEWGQCVSTVTAETETCDGKDNDCSGTSDDNNACPNGRACLRNGTKFACAMCTAATVAIDCPAQMVCKLPSCNSTSGACEYMPDVELTPCARAGALEGFCKSGSCQPPATATGNRMNPGEALAPGQKLANGIYSLTCQADGNLVMSHTDGSSQITDWSSGSSGAAAECVMQPDGNLVIYGDQMNAIWASFTGTAGTYVGNYLLLGQNSLKIISSTGAVVSALK